MPLSDHADYDELFEAVARVEPRWCIARTGRRVSSIGSATPATTPIRWADPANESCFERWTSYDHTPPIAPRRR